MMMFALCCNFDISAHQLTRLKLPESGAENGHSDETCPACASNLNETGVILDVINISVWLQGQRVE